MGLFNRTISRAKRKELEKDVELPSFNDLSPANGIASFKPETISMDRVLDVRPSRMASLQKSLPPDEFSSVQGTYNRLEAAKRREMFVKNNTIYEQSAGASSGIGIIPKYGLNNIAIDPAVEDMDVPSSDPAKKRVKSWLERVSQDYKQGKTSMDLPTPGLPPATFEEGAGIAASIKAEEDMAKPNWGILMERENSHSSSSGGWDSDKKLWTPHGSLEGGTRTIAYGHKLDSDDQKEVYGINIENGITEAQAKEIFEKDVEIRGQAVDDKFGEGTWDKWDKNQKVLAMSLLFGGNKAIDYKAMQAVNDKDYDKYYIETGDISWQDSSGKRHSYRTRNDNLFKSLNITPSDEAVKKSKELSKKAGLIDGNSIFDQIKTGIKKIIK